MRWMDVLRRYRLSDLPDDLAAAASLPPLSVIIINAAAVVLPLQQFLLLLLKDRTVDDSGLKELDHVEEEGEQGDGSDVLDEALPHRVRVVHRLHDS